MSGSDQNLHKGHFVDQREKTFAHSNENIMDSWDATETPRSLMMTARSQGRMKSIRLDSRPFGQEKLHSQSDEVNMFDVKAFMRENFEQRVCSKFVLDPKKENTCGCGRSKQKHGLILPPISETPEHTVSGATPAKWNCEDCTKTEPVTSYGSIRFRGYGNENQEPSQYIRICSDTKVENLENVWTLMSEHWHVPPPRLIISVTGGAKNFYVKNKLKASFKKGLINAARTTGAWIVTSGTNAGVTQLVGEAALEHNLTKGSDEQHIVVVGIASWGVIDNKDTLVSQDGMGKFPAEYCVEDLNIGARGIASLEPNHPYFILCDDGTEGKYSREFDFRVAFEQYLSQKLETAISSTGKPGTKSGVSIPVVLLVMEGGLDSLRIAVTAIKQGTPVVVVQGSGRLSNYIARAMSDSKELCTDGVCVSEFPPGFEKKYSDIADEMFDWQRIAQENRQKELGHCVENLKVLLKHRRMIKIFQLDDSETTNEIDEAILEALLTAKSMDINTQLNLALAWNRCDVARDKILTSSVEDRNKWQKCKDLLYDCMFSALVHNRIDFVQLFLDSGVDLKKFLTIRRLRDLYTAIVLDCNPVGCADLIHRLVNETEAVGCSSCCRSKDSLETEEKFLELIGNVIAHLLGDQTDRMYQGDDFVVAAKTDIAEVVKKQHSDTTYQASGTSGQKEFSNNMIDKLYSTFDFECAAKELFLWAVLLNRRELALIFWKNGKDHIGGALIASALLKSLAHEAEAEEEIDLSAELMDHSVTYENHAVGTLNECYTKDKLMAHQLLVRELQFWGRTTVFTVADSAEHMDFMGHVCCQTKLNDIWKGCMALHTPLWKILISMLLPFMVFFIKFNKPMRQSKDQILRTSKERKMDRMGSPYSTNKVSPMEDSGGRRGNYYVAEDGTDLEFKGSKKTGGKSQKLLKVGCAMSDPEYINFFVACYQFHHSPVVKFYYHTFSFMIFLGLFSYMVLVSLHPGVDRKDSWIEFLVWVWAATLVCEEVRQIIMRDPKTLTYKVSGYLSSIWNVFDQFVHFMFLTAVVLRFALPDEHFSWARIFYCLTLVMYYIRFLQQFFVAKNLGPKVLMIKGMLYDLMFFVLILIVFILSYGVAAQALRYPNSDPTWSLLKDVVYHPYWQMYGELFLEEINSNEGSCTNDTMTYPHLPPCSENNGLVLVMFAIYMILTNVLLLNLLIAMFSNTFQRVEENSEKVWRYYRYSLIYEYFDRPTFAPPLIIITIVLRFIKYIQRKCTGEEKISNDFKAVLKPQVNNRLTAFEQVGMENYVRNKHLLEKEHINTKVSTAGERIEKVIDDLETLKEQISPNASASEEKAPTVHSQISTENFVVKQDIEEMNDRMFRLESSINRMVDFLYSNNSQRDIHGGGDTGPRLVEQSPTVLVTENIPLLSSQSLTSSFGSQNTSMYPRTGVFKMRAPAPGNDYQ